MMKTLLLIDDDGDRLAIIERTLAPLGHEVRRARWKEAKTSFRDQRPDLVLVGLDSGGAPGLEFVREIRRGPGGDRVRAVALLSAGSGRELRLRALAAGADDLVETPIEGERLRCLVRVLGRQLEPEVGLREVNLQLALRNASLERGALEQRELTAFIVHDLKNPLASLSSNLEYAREGLGPANPFFGALEEAWESSRRLRSMIEDLLVVSRLEQCAFPLRLETISLGELMAEVLREYDRRAEEKGVELVKPRALKTRVTSDRSLLQRIIENILDNSLRHTPENGRVGVDLRVDLRGEHQVEIAVSNSGPAIPPEERARIFDKFARLDGSSSRANVGLGLYFCKRAVESLGGDIAVTQTADWPTSFIVRIPIVTQAA